ncbi:plant intracellular Ras-group-related LRR protein 6 [Dioscorea cayenensis subsp. rotundata]|uniref:Plant intracellular Ras-group-related LRR protein 6 n=1 Tax=Dioscorea cayennensis subsp. rotundata TaxID=55577 RepID=A0AB40C186_DIOCR|nr:plant intracellular Ras-group-related LRR protein 6 [Dioscorea cayenensis subsp. rotundata]
MAQIDTYNTTYGKQYYYVLTCFKTSLYEGCVLCIQSIPESLAARMLNVVVLDLHSNQLQALPNSIGCLSKLKILNVSGNLLKSFPKTIEDCRALEELIANFNQLNKLPETMGFELTNLRKLSVNSNKLAFLPQSTSHMTNLRVLDARLNCLHCLPDDLENLIRLEVLNVSQNFHYLHSLPYSIGLLTSLLELDISYNKITVLPDSISCLTKLHKFHAEGNPLVSPPVEVVDHSIDAVREYLITRMNGVPTGKPSAKKTAWLSRLVKCGSFNGGMGVNSRPGVYEHNGFLLTDYRSIVGIASPRHAGMFSPRRLFSPRRFSPWR